MTEPREPKIPVRIRRLLLKLKGGATLCRSLAPCGGVDQYFLEPGGRNVGQQTALRAISEGYVVPNGDGLFGDTQTYRVPQ